MPEWSVLPEASKAVKPLLEFLNHAME